MKLKSLRLKNFRRFYGEQEIIFSTDSKKTFTIIHAENGTGKSNLLNAINWCLFDECVSGTQDPGLIINTTHEIEKPKSFSTEVKLVIEDDGKITTFIRKQLQGEPSVLKVYEGEDDIPVDKFEHKAKIESLIPKELSKYFFFHGEGLKNLTNDAQSVKSAVQDIQGITDAKEVLDEIVRNKNILNGKITKSGNSSKKLDELSKEISEIRDLKLKKQARHKEKNQERNDINSEIDILNKEIAQSNLELVRKNQDIRQQSEKKINDLKSKIKHHELRKFNYSQNYYQDVITAPMAEECKKIIDKLQEGGKFPADLSDNLIQQIFEIEKCICGREVKIGSNEFKHLESWLTKAADVKFTTDVISLVSLRDKTLQNSKMFMSNTADHEQIKAQLESQLAEANKEYDDADNYLNNVEQDDIEQINKEIKKLKDKRDKVNDEINGLTDELVRLESVLAPKERDQKIELEKSNLDPSLKNQFNFLEVAARRLEKLLASYENKAQEFVKDRINDYFRRFATKEFKVEFDSNFLPSLLERNIRDIYTPAPESSGENLLKNIAFVCSLMEFSALRAETKNTRFQIEGVKSPFVIDAPFGDSDGRYSNALAKILVNCNADQIVIFLSKKHYEGSFEKITEDKKLVGKRYIIENHATNKEKEKLDAKEDNEEIKINGKKYKQFFLSKEFGFSKIREV